jgi:dihydropteroate synthase
MRLIEPLGLLDGPEAEACVAAGLAFRLGHTGLAFTLVRLIDWDHGTDRVERAADLAPPWRERLEELAKPPTAWAGMPLSRPAVMGIVNVTPDSFSDGGERLRAEDAIAAGEAMAKAGADILDIGGESTRPGSFPVPAQEEQARILPVIRSLAGLGLPISVDTRNAATMAAALDNGATIINDVSALQHDPDALATVAKRECSLVLMHMRGTPSDMAAHANYRDVAVEVTLELAERVAAAERAGIDRARIAVDPGIGFAKNSVQNLMLLRRLPLLMNLGCTILVGLSRKRFLAGYSGGAGPKQRGPASLAGGLFALARGARVLRVHDVAETIQAVRTWHGLTRPALMP